jgi:hypothetical protein
MSVCAPHPRHRTGDVYAWQSDRGLYRSTDQAKGFRKLGPRVVRSAVVLFIFHIA